MINDTQTNKHQLGALTGASKCQNYYELHFATGETAHFYILADGIFRLLVDPDQNFTEIRTPFIQLAAFTADAFEQSTVRATSDSLIIQAGTYQIIFEQKPFVMSIFDEALHRTRMAQARPLELAANGTSESLVQNKNEYYFGGGLQNGYFSHKGHKIVVARDQITGKGGVILQVPFFWSSAGYGEVRNTKQSGTYDFGKLNPRETTIEHLDRVFDSFYLLGNNPQEMLAKYYTLTGQPMLLPKYMLGLGHIGNFCTTLWQPSQAKERNASKFGSNFYTRTSDTSVVSGRASLNGEENYQFSARAMIDRYRELHLPLSWFIPNYGVNEVSLQAASFFNDYAHNQGVQPGFWHDQSKTLPEQTAFTFTNDADTAADLEQLQRQANKHPFTSSSGGFMGQQKHTALLFGGVGGNWENIATQVAGLIGANLSGQPLAGAAVDGAEGGGNAQIYVRDFQWKSFTPLLFNLDDQGNFSKTPFAYNRRITEINQAYLQLRTRLTSYLYTLNAHAKAGEPIIRPLFLAFPDEQTNYSEQFSSEFMLGDNLLIAPITNGREDENGNARKDNLYLPDQSTMWIDLFTGQKYAGGRVYNNLTYPVWHLPVFVRGGSIFDFGKRDYVFYPQGERETVTYSDNESDDNSIHYETKISSKLDENKLTITIDPAKGDLPGAETMQETKLSILCDSYPHQIAVKVNDREIPLQACGTADAFEHAREGIFYNSSYGLPEFSQYQELNQKALQIKLDSHDITTNKIEITIHNFTYSQQVLVHEVTSGLLPTPKLPAVDSNKITAHSFELAWTRPSRVQIEINHLLYEGISGTSFTCHELTPNTRYIIRIRYVSGNRVSEWSELFGVITKPAAADYAIEQITATSNFTSNPQHPLSYLTDLKLASEWQTEEAATPDHPLELTFTFEQVEKLSRIVFVPRNLDHSGDPTEVSIAISEDGINYTPYAFAQKQAQEDADSTSQENYTAYSDQLQWKADSKNKVVGLRDVQAKAVRLTVYQSSGPIVAAREIFFYRAKK
ncbi:TIM-barrel domain-containing protein [Lactobacillus xylocopicola]|uniref:Alpha-glucosidase n=1 Tax=Lactobacillus xylocopicola TaxID=2976676 RepID=A0ABN6SPU9_9LACO|nr:TIM-barrel domain-containing protein [Lactobacillus xylocopicola]BDR61127.1 alpha-glucosidase [Lactobacillus xylocopicola]